MAPFIHLFWVIVNDVNDNAPRFGHILNLSLNRSTPVGSMVFRIRIEDPDLAENARNWFSLSGEGVEEAERLFSIDKWTGEMTLIRELTGEKINALRFGITAQDEKWHVQSIMTVQIIEDENEQRTNRMPTEAKTFEFVAFGEGGDQRTEEELAQTEQLGRVPGRCYAMPTIGWAWTKHEGTETALIADRRLFKLLERGEGTAEREIALFCADGIGQQKVRLRWRRSPAVPSDFPPINLPIDHSVVHPPTSVHLFFIPYPNAPPIILPPASIPSLLIANRSETAQIGRVIVDDGEEEKEESEQTESKWHFELEDQCDDQSWIRVDKRSGIISANASAIAFPTDWTDGQKLIGVKVTDQSGQRNGMGKFRVISPLPTSVLTPKFVRRIWHFSVPRHSPNGTIVGQLQIDDPKGNKIWQIVMDAKSEKAFGIDQMTGELTIRNEEGTNLKRKKKVANGGEEEAEEATIVVALIGAAGDELFDRCVVRVFFSRLRPPCVTFPSPHFSVRLSSTASDQTVLLRFDIIRHTDFKIVLSDPPPLPFCFSARSPSVLSLCSSLSPLRLSSLSSSVPLLLFLLLLHPSGRVCSRSSVSVFILPSSSSLLPFVPVGGVGFVRRNALPGQNVLQFRNGRGPFEMVDQQMDKLFRLHPSSGVLSTRISFVGLRLPSLLPIVVRSHNATFHLFVLLEEQQWKNANVSSESNAKIEVILPMISSDKTTNGKEELQLFATEYANPNRRRCVPTLKRLYNGFRSNVTITSSCSLLLSPLPLSSVPFEFVPLGNGISLRIDSLHLLLVLPRLVELRLFSSTKNLATILGAIERAVPDLVLLLPFVLSADFSAPFGFHRLLIAFRDQNGNILAQSDAVRLLQHFFLTFSDLSDNSWNLRVEETNFQVEEENGILDCLKGPREVIGTAQKVWAPIKADESCLSLGSIFTPKCPSSPIASANELISPPVLSFMPSGNFNDHFGFVRFSGILLPHVRLISLQFLTAQSSALLLYFSLNSASSFFLSVDLINGKPRLNVGLTFPLQSRVIEKSVNDEKWWHLELSWTKRRVTLALAECQREDENGDECAQMSHGVHRVHVHLQQENNLLLHPPSLRFSPFVIFGDLSAFPDLIRHSAGRTSDFSFVGCQRRISIDGIEIIGQDLAILEERLEQFMAEINATTSSTCPLIGNARNEWPNICHGENARKACGKGICVPEGSDSFTCQCESQQVESANCEQVLFSASLHFRPLRFVLSSRTFNRLSFVPLPGNLVHSLPRRPLSLRRGEDENIQFADGLNVLALDFHSSNLENGQGEETLLCIEFEDLLLMIAVEMSVNSLRFILHRHTNNTQTTPFPLSFQLAVNSSTPLDIHWHRLAMGVSPDGTMLRLQLDDMAPVVHRSTLLNFFPFPLRSRLQSLSLGSTCSSLNAHQNLSAFRGCVRRFLINNQLQQIHPQMAPLPSHKRFLRLLIEENQPGDAISQLCLSAKSVDHAIFASTFAVISVLFLLSFVLFAIVFRFKRRKRKESAKRNRNVQISSSFVTQSQTPPIIVPLPSNCEEEEQKMAKLENWRAMAVSTDTFSSLGFSSCSTFPRHSNIIGPSDAEDST
ncbi:hypothetical protein niasHT_007385 [Heterodera trifolii]|uniref:Cadherin domain-containing protein n=1 Tax=Heterodera trifolii TaxID=157864 RepID=A0ABD2LLH8_9BILA